MTNRCINYKLGLVHVFLVGSKEKLGRVLDKELVLFVSVGVELSHGRSCLKYKKITNIISCVSCAMC